MNIMSSALVLFFFCFSGSALAMTYGDYIAIKEANKPYSNIVIESHLDAIANTIRVYDDIATSMGAQRLICFTKDVQLSPATIQRYINKSAAAYKLKSLNMQLSKLALIAAVTENPCSFMKKTKKKSPPKR